MTGVLGRSPTGGPTPVSADSSVFRHEAVDSTCSVFAPVQRAERSVLSQTGLPVSSISVVPVPGDSHRM